MNNITELIDLDEDETILEIFQGKHDETRDINYIDKDYHNLLNLPNSFFQVDDESISYRFTHVFTNKRYIGIGLYFWQLFDLYCNDEDIRSKIKIENYILSIQKEDLCSIKIDIGTFSSSINLSHMVKLVSYSNRLQYNKYKTFLIEKWGVSPSEFEMKENQTCSDKAKLYLIINFYQFFVVGFYLVKFYLEFLSEEDNYLLLWLKILIIVAIGLIILSIILLIGQKMKKKLLMIRSLRAIIMTWYILIMIAWLFFSRFSNTAFLFIFGFIALLISPYATDTRKYVQKITGFSGFDSWRFLVSDLFSSISFSKTKNLLVKMEDIRKIIKFDADEIILGIFQDEKREKRRIRYILEKYHKIEDLPKSVFKVDKDFISYKMIHIFTNKRYYNIGINFWQIFEIQLRKEITIDNYILSIEKENLKTVEIDFGFMSDLGFSRSSIYLNPLVDLKCVKNEHYNEVKTFLIEKWDIPPSNFEKEEIRNIKKFKRLTLFKHFFEILFIWGGLYGAYTFLQDNNELLSWFILLCICASYSIISTIIGLIGQKNRVLIRVILRSNVINWLVLILCYLFIF